MVSAFCHTLIAVLTGPSRITSTAVSSPRVCTGSMNTRVIGTVVYIWNISKIFFNTIPCNFNNTKMKQYSASNDFTYVAQRSLPSLVTCTLKGTFRVCADAIVTR